MPMNILYIHQYFCTPAGPGGVRSYEFARRWVEEGHGVDVLTGVGVDHTLEGNRVLDIDGIRVHTLGISYDNELSFTARLWSFAVFAAKATVRAARARNYDTVLASSTPLSVAIPALAAKLLGHKRIIFEVRDVWPDAAVDAGVLKSTILIALARLLEMATYRAVDHIVPLSTGMQDRLLGKGVPRDKMTVIPNCCDLDLFEPCCGASRKGRELTSDDRFVILYVGAVSLANDIGFLANAIELTRPNARVEWWFVGGGNRLELLKQRVKDCGAENVRFLGPQPKQAIPGYMAQANVGIVSFLPTPVFYENSPNKFFDYIAAGLPVIYSRTTWLAPEIEKSNAGFVCASNSPQEMVCRIEQLQEDEGLRSEMGQNARTLAEQKFSRNTMAAKYLTLFAP